MSLCVPCREEGREQEHHHFLDREDGRGPVPACRWHFKGLPYPASRIAKTLPARPAEGGEKMSRRSTIDDANVKALHAQGLNDREISERLDCGQNVIAQHRKKLGLTAIGRHGSREKAAPHVQQINARAKAASAGGEFKRVHTPAAPQVSGNGSGALVSVRVEVLDAMWAGLEPEDKARLVNHLIEARGR